MGRDELREPALGRELPEFEKERAGILGGPPRSRLGGLGSNGIRSSSVLASFK